ncbi:hypothetical protein BaRGS_00020903, partial [Batillaria attramentaria]
SDLTRKQTAELKRLKTEGKSGYYRNGKLVVTDRNRPGGRRAASHTGDGGDYRQHGRHHSQGRHYQRQSRRGDERQYRPVYDREQYGQSNYHQQLYNYSYDDWPRLDVTSNPTLRWFGDPASREAEWRNARPDDWDESGHLSDVSCGTVTSTHQPPASSPDCASEACNTPPAGSGTGSVPDPSPAGSGTGGVPDPSPAGSGTVSVPDPSPAGSGTGSVPDPSPAGSGTGSLPDPSPAGSGTGSVPDPSPAGSGTGSVPDPSPAGSGTGSVPDPSPAGSGTGSVPDPSPAGSGTGSVPDPSPAGSGTGSVPDPSPAGSGTGSVPDPSLLAVVLAVYRTRHLLAVVLAVYRTRHLLAVSGTQSNSQVGDSPPPADSDTESVLPVLPTETPDTQHGVTASSVHVQPAQQEQVRGRPDTAQAGSVGETGTSDSARSSSRSVTRQSLIPDTWAPAVTRQPTRSPVVTRQQSSSSRKLGCGRDP